MQYESPLTTIKRVAEFLGEPLPSDSKALRAHLIGLEATRLELAEKRSDWLKMLHEKENQMLHPKDQALTEMDRRVMLHASTAIIRRDYDFLCSLEKLTEERLDFGKLLLTIT